MSNKIDHDIISGKIEKLFESSKEYLIKSKIKGDLDFQENQIGKTGISLAENKLIHLDVNSSSSISIMKDCDARVYKILQPNDECDMELLSQFNLSDSPSVVVSLGRTSKEFSSIMKEIDDASTKLNKELKKITKSKVKKSSMKKPF